MKRRNCMKMKDFIVNDIDDVDDGENIEDVEYERKPKKQKSGKIRQLEKTSKDRNVSMEDVLKLKLPDDENIWFYENINIRDDMEEMEDLKECYNMKIMIYEKYNYLKNINSHKLQQIKDKSKVEDDIVARIINSNYDDSVKALMYKKYKRCHDNTRDNSSDELYKILDWIDTVLDLPSNKIQPAKQNTSVESKLTNLSNRLNKNVYGLDKLKERILESVCTKLINTDTKGKVLTFVGPPGVGKTAMSMAIADALEMPFDQISFGSIKDSSALTGHMQTYIGAVPGLFTKILTKSERYDMVILLDEIDKIPMTAEGKSITTILFHVLDKTQNNKFKDMYIPEVPLDLSKILFLCAANSLDDLQAIDIEGGIEDRMTVIEIDGYSNNDKAHIAMKHMFPKVLAESGFNQNELLMNEQTMLYLINNKVKQQQGMRDTERKLYELCEKIALLKYSKGIKLSYNLKNITFPFKITNNVIDELLKN